jgi:hypothetical protein
MDFQANFMKALLDPGTGAGICIPVTISSAARIVEPGTAASEFFCFNKPVICLSCRPARRQPAPVAGFTARQALTAPNMEWYLLSPISHSRFASFRRQ